MNIKLLIESGNDFADNDNHGDRAILGSIVARLRRVWPDCEIRWVTAEVNHARARSAGVTPVAPGEIASETGRIALLRDCDLVLATGGGYFTDSFAPHARRVLDTLAAGLELGKPAAILSCGFEPISDRLLTAKMLAVLPKLGLIVCREPLQSPDVLRSVGVSMDHLCIAGDEAVAFAYDRRPEDSAAGSASICDAPIMLAPASAPSPISVPCCTGRSRRSTRRSFRSRSRHSVPPTSMPSATYWSILPTGSMIAAALMGPRTSWRVLAIAAWSSQAAITRRCLRCRRACRWWRLSARHITGRNSAALRPDFPVLASRLSSWAGRTPPQPWCRPLRMVGATRTWCVPSCCAQPSGRSGKARTPMNACVA